MAVSKRTRFEVLRRDNHQCRYCGLSADVAPLTIDHVVPVSLGGDDKPDNLVAACKDCNAGKSSSHPNAALVAQVAEDVVRWSHARHVAIRQFLQEREDLEQLHDMAQDYFLDTWNAYKRNDTGEPIELPVDWDLTINRWAEDGLPFTGLVDDAVKIAMGRRNVPYEKRFAYFLGVMKNMIADLDERTRGFLSAPDCVDTSYETLVFESLHQATSRTD